MDATQSARGLSLLDKFDTVARDSVVQLDRYSILSTLLDYLLPKPTTLALQDDAKRNELLHMAVPTRTLHMPRLYSVLSGERGGSRASSTTGCIGRHLHSVIPS